MDNKEYHKAYYQKNKEKFAKYHEEWRKKNSEKLKEYSKKYREKNKEKLTIYLRRYYDKNKERINISNLAYKKGRALLVSERGGKCVKCGKDKNLILHHEDYETFDEKKLMLLCRSCHRKIHLLKVI